MLSTTHGAINTAGMTPEVICRHALQLHSSPAQHVFWHLSCLGVPCTHCPVGAYVACAHTIRPFPGLCCAEVIGTVGIQKPCLDCAAALTAAGVVAVRVSAPCCVQPHCWHTGWRTVLYFKQTSLGLTCRPVTALVYLRHRALHDLCDNVGYPACESVHAGR